MLCSPQYLRLDLQYRADRTSSNYLKGNKRCYLEGLSVPWCKKRARGPGKPRAPPESSFHRDSVCVVRRHILRPSLCRLVPPITRIICVVRRTVGLFIGLRVGRLPRGLAEPRRGTNAYDRNICRHSNYAANQILPVQPRRLRHHAARQSWHSTSTTPKTLPQGCRRYLRHSHSSRCRRSNFPDGPENSGSSGASFSLSPSKSPCSRFHTLACLTRNNGSPHGPAPSILAGVLPENGGPYGFSSLLTPVSPRLTRLFGARIIHIVIVLSLISIIYGAVVCLMQKDMKRLIAYLVVQPSLVSAPWVSSRLRRRASRASVLQADQSTASPPVRSFLIRRCPLRNARHTSFISEFGGLANTHAQLRGDLSHRQPKLPRYAAASMVSSANSPSCKAHSSRQQNLGPLGPRWALFSVLPILLWLYQRTMFQGPVHTRSETNPYPTLNLREYGVSSSAGSLLPSGSAFTQSLFFAYIEKARPATSSRQVNPGFYQGNRTLPPSHARCDTCVGGQGSRRPCHSSFLERDSINYVHGDGVTVLPQMELLLFALGILIFDFLLEEKKKSIGNAGLALLGVFRQAPFGLFMQAKRFNLQRESRPDLPGLPRFSKTPSWVERATLSSSPQSFSPPTALVILLSVRFISISSAKQGRRILCASCFSPAVGMMFMASATGP